jgi:purine-cytosine permease-like protein
MADDDDVRGAPGPEELFAPTGPRRSSFTPAPNDAESLEAAANLFDDDEIAAALSAELARVASGPIAIHRPPVEPEPAAAEPAGEPTAEVPPPPVAPAPVPDVAPAAAPEPVAAPTPVADLPPAPAAPQGPPDWATPLFSEQAAAAPSEPAQPPSDPFAPSAPSFAPSNGPFPPPGPSAPTPPQSPFFGATAPAPLSDSEQIADPAHTADADALRALYAAAPAPTVPPADAPPPPGYESGTPVVPSPGVESPGTPGDLRPRRRALPDEGAEAGTLSALEQLQAQLDDRDREAREYAAWESSMLEVGTPEALAAVDEARTERSGVVQSPPEPPQAPPVPSTPVPSTPEPATFLPPPEPTAAEPIPFLPPPFDEPATDNAPPTDEPVFDLAPPTEESPFDLAPPTDEQSFDLAPPSSSPSPEPVFDLAPPSNEPVFDLAPPPDEPATDLAPPTEDAVPPMSPPSDEATSAVPPPVVAPGFFVPSAADIASVPPPPSEATPFPGFGTPADAPTMDFAPPSDPHELIFDPPPPLVQPPEPDGLADLWRDASDDADLATPPSAPVPEDVVAAAPVEPVEQSPAEPQPLEAQPVEQSPLEQQAAAQLPSAQSPPASAGPPAGFEDLLTGSGAPDPGPPSSGWVAADGVPSPAAEEERRPFGEGVDRDEAVDPTDSIFGTPPAPVSVNTAGVAVVPTTGNVVPEPINFAVAGDSAATGTQAADTDEQVVPVAPRISPPESTGLEPTAIEHRVGRSARLFWLWFAANSSIAAVVFGTIIFALGVSLRQAVVATLAGVALSFIPLGLGTLAGKRSGQPTMVISRATFGVVGNILPALLALLSRVFWAAALLWVLGAGTADILIGAKLTDGFTRGELTLGVIAIGFVVAVVIAYFGYALVAIIQLVVSIVSGIAILGFIALTWRYVNLTTAVSTPDGSWILVITGAVLVFSFVGLAWANSSADVARYQRPGSSGAASMLWATFGVAIPSFLLIAYGALLASSNATLAANIASDPLDSLGRLLPLWYPAPLLAATGLSLVSGVVLAMYSGAFALQAVGLRLRRSLSTLLIGLLVVAIAIVLSTTVIEFSQLFRDIATTVAVPIAAWAGLFGAEIMIRKRRFDSTSLLERGGVYEDVRWGNLIALIVITAIGYGFLSATLTGLSWEGYLFSALGVPLQGQLATTDLGVLVALVLGLLVPLVGGRGGISKQEKATRVPE